MIIGPIRSVVVDGRAFDVARAATGAHESREGGSRENKSCFGEHHGWQRVKLGKQIGSRWEMGPVPQQQTFYT